MVDVISIGNVTVDYQVKPDKELPKWGRLCRIENPIVQSIGGNGALFSAFLRGLGRSNTLYGSVGDDDRGQWVLENMRDRKISTEGIKTAKGALTDTTVTLVDQQGRRAFIHHQGAGAQSRVEDLPKVMKAQWFHMASYLLLPRITGAAAVRTLKKARSDGLFTSLDVAWDPTGGWDIKSVLEHVDVLFLNVDEGEQITGSDAPLDILEMLGKAGPRLTVLKMGESGCSVYTATGESFFAPSFEIDVVDTTGAGDAFCAGFIEGCLNKVLGKGRKGGRRKGNKERDILKSIDLPDLQKVTILANALGGMSTQSLGVPGHLPTMKDLLAFVKKGKKALVFQ